MIYDTLIKKITNTSRDPHPFFFSRVARRNFFEVPLSREARRKIFTYSREARRIFFDLALLFLVQEAVDQIATTGRPAPIAGLALSFLVQEAGLEQR